MQGISGRQKNRHSAGVKQRTMLDTLDNLYIQLCAENSEEGIRSLFLKTSSELVQAGAVDQASGMYLNKSQKCLTHAQGHVRNVAKPAPFQD